MTEQREVGVEFSFEFAAAALARHEGLAVEVDAGRPAGSDTKSCLNVGMAARAVCPRQSGLIGTSRQPSTVSPTSSTVASMRRDRLVARHRFGRQEGHSGGVSAGYREFEVDHGSQECIRHLDQDAGAVTRVRLGAGGAAMFHVGERLESGEHEFVRAHTLQAATNDTRGCRARSDGSFRAMRPGGCSSSHPRVSRYTVTSGMPVVDDRWERSTVTCSRGVLETRWLESGHT